MQRDREKKRMKKKKKRHFLDSSSSSEDEQTEAPDPTRKKILKPHSNSAPGKKPGVERKKIRGFYFDEEKQRYFPKRSQARASKRRKNRQMLRSDEESRPSKCVVEQKESLFQCLRLRETAHYGRNRLRDRVVAAFKKSENASGNTTPPANTALCLATPANISQGNFMVFYGGERGHFRYQCKARMRVNWPRSEPPLGITLLRSTHTRVPATIDSKISSLHYNRSLQGLVVTRFGDSVPGRVEFSKTGFEFESQFHLDKGSIWDSSISPDFGKGSLNVRPNK